MAIRCTIDAQVARWAPLHADARATSARAALSEALDRFERRLRRAARIARDGRRRPKKYFLAAVANGGERRS